MSQNDLRNELELGIAQGDKLSPATLDVIIERQRQISAEGWTPEHDDTHPLGELAGAAAIYAEGARGQILIGTPGGALYGLVWPWKGQPNWKGPRENLVRAGALILAEIERLDRASGKSNSALA